MVTKVQVNVSGYGSEPCTVLAVIDEDGIWFINEISYQTERKSRDVMMITYSPSTNAGDIAFTDKDLSKAISLTFDLQSRKMVRFAPEFKNSAQFDPKTRVQLGKVTETGKDYQLSSEITNKQMAYLCTAWAFHVVEAQESVADFAKQIDDMQSYFMTI